MISERICSIEGCGKPHHARGWCGTHHERWRRHGDPLVTLIVGTPKGEPMTHLRATVLAETDDGKCVFWSYSRDSNGHGQVWCDGRLRYVTHVALELVGRKAPVGPMECCHLCGNGHLACYYTPHLVNGTHAENMAAMVIHGTSARGERSGRAKLTMADVLAIRAATGTGREIAKRYEISPSTVSDIRSGRSWSWL